jgi:hypothetical protein
MSDVLVSIVFGHSSFTVESSQGKVKVYGTQTSKENYLTENEIELISLITESIVAINKGIQLGRYFNPLPQKGQKEFQSSNKYFKAKWTKNGYLKLLGETDKKFKHVSNATEALNRVGVFTCDIEMSESILNNLPVKKENTNALLKMKQSDL